MADIYYGCYILEKSEFCDILIFSELVMKDSYQMFQEHGGGIYAVRLARLIRVFYYQIECVQIDNGTELEFVTFFTPRIKSCWKDNESFLYDAHFYSFEDFRQQLKRYNGFQYVPLPEIFCSDIEGFRAAQYNACLMNLHLYTNYTYQ